MREIDGIKLEALDNGAHFEYHTSTVKRAKADSAVSTRCTKYLTPYEAALDGEDDVYKTSTKDPLTDQIEESDLLRDTIYRGYRDSVKAMSVIPIEATQQAAKTLLQHIKDYKIDVRDQLDKESGKLRNFTADLKGKYAEQVATLGLTDVVNSLATANEKTATLIQERDDANKDAKTGLMKQARAKVDEAYRMLIKVVNALMLVEDEAAYADFADKQNAQIRRYKQRVLGQTSDNKNPDEGGEEPTPEPTTPEITKFYPKEGANPDRPLDFPRNKTAVLEGKGLKLVDSPEGKKAQLVLINYVDQRMPHEDSAILLNTDEKIEFTMMYDAAEGQYNFQIETYPNGTEEAVIIKYPETITLV